MLEVSGLHTGYDETQVIHGLDLAAPEGRLLAVLGRNGAGKTTLLQAIVGLLPAWRGEIRLDGRDITGMAPYEIAWLGIAYVPETRDIFPSLSVRENLELAHRVSTSGRWTMDTVLDFFPALAGRLGHGGNQLSGGEQQMLAIARALLMNPRLLVLDEPTEGLAPVIVDQLLTKLLELKSAGMTILLVEQNFGFATRLADEVVVLGRGIKVWEGNSEAICKAREVQKEWLGV